MMNVTKRIASVSLYVISLILTKQQFSYTPGLFKMSIMYCLRQCYISFLDLRVCPSVRLRSNLSMSVGQDMTFTYTIYMCPR